MTPAVSLAGSAFLQAPRTVRLLKVLDPAGDGAVTRIVGGAVRNALMGEPVGDIDCATTLTPDDVVRLAGTKNLRTVPTGIRFGTVTVLVDGTPFEVTTLRRDVTSDGRWADVSFGSDWQDDARRRDFTINALYCDAQGRIHDPLGGYDDVIARRVRFIGDAHQRIAEDYLRVLRFFRFHAWYGRGAPDAAGFHACATARRHMGQLSAERLRQEMLKFLSAPECVGALRAFADTGVLIDLVGVPAVGCLERLVALEKAHARAPFPVLRLAALAVRIEEDAERLTARLRLSRAESRFLADMGRWGRRLAGDTSQHGHRLAQEALGQDYAHAHLFGWALSRDEATDPRRHELADLATRDPVPVFPLKGEDMLSLGIAAGKAIGDGLATARALWIASDFRLGREALLAHMTTDIKRAGVCALEPSARVLSIGGGGISGKETS